MKVRELIEMLAKQNWDAEVRIDIRLNRISTPTSVKEAREVTIPIKSISSYTAGKAPFVTLNERSVYSDLIKK